jgi:CRP-like cAMP-binding protein
MHECETSCCDNHHDECVRNVPLFESLKENEFALIQQTVQRRLYRKGDSIFREGDLSDGLYVINEGTIKISKLSDAGKEHVLRFLFPGDFSGQFALFHESQHYTNAEALSDTTACHIHRAHLRAMLQDNPHITYQFLVALSNQLRTADEWGSTINLLDVEKRLAKTLLLFSANHGLHNTLELPVAKKEFASLLSVTPETLSRKLAQFESQDVIALLGKRKILIRDRKALEKLSGVV